MKVDLLRQLDEWGNHLEASIEHIEAEELMRNASERTKEAESETLANAPVRAARPLWRIPIRVAGVAAVVLAVGWVGWNSLSQVEDRASGFIGQEFRSVGGEVDGRPSPPAIPTTAAPMTAAPAATTTAAPSYTAWSQNSATTAAPTTTLPPDTTAAPGGTVPPAGTNPANLGRDVIFTGDLAIDTRDVSAAVVAARAIVRSSGGYVFGQELGGAATVMSLKIPAEFFEDAVERLSELGTVRTVRITSQDVTERIVDLESQISTSEVSVDRLRALLAEAGNINAITRLESELLDRETNLERLRGQLRTLQDQVALSTIVLTLREFVPSPALLMDVGIHEIGDGSGEQCFTAERRRPARGDDYVVCVDMTNTGNVPITDIEIAGPDEVVADLVPVRGTRITTLAPGERYVLWATARATESRREEIVVKAVPLSEEGARLVEQTVEVRDPLNVTVAPEPEPEPEPEAEGLPSLGDSLAAGWKVLATGANALAVAVAFVLPLLWIPLLAGLFLWWRRRRT